MTWKTGALLAVAAASNLPSVAAGEDVVANAGILFPQLAGDNVIQQAVTDLGTEAGLYDLSFAPETLTHQLLVQVDVSQQPQDTSLQEVCSTLENLDTSVGCSFDSFAENGEWQVEFSLEYEQDYDASGEVASFDVDLPLSGLRSACDGSEAASIFEWQESHFVADSSTMLEGTFVGADGTVFMALQELGEAEGRLQAAVGIDGAEVAVLPVTSSSATDDSTIVSKVPASHHSGERQAPASTGRGIQRAAVEKDAPVYRALAGFGHDPYCSDPYADPYNPYCAFCEINDLEDSLPDGYVIVSAETTNYHPAGGIIEQDSGALVGCDDGYTATFGDEPAAVNCSLTLESDGDGYEDRSAPFVFDSHPPVGGGLTCFPTDLLPMQYCDTNPVTVEHNLRTSNPGLIDIGDNISVVCRGGYTDPDDDDNSDVLFCNAGPNTSVAASFGEGLSCVDIDSICVVSPGQCTTLADTSISFEQCDNMLDGGNLIDEFNDAFLDFLFGFLGFSVVPPPQLSPTCGSIYLNAYFDDPADAAAFRNALIDAFQNNNITELEFTFNGETVSFSLEDLITTEPYTGPPTTTTSAYTGPPTTTTSAYTGPPTTTTSAYTGPPTTTTSPYTGPPTTTTSAYTGPPTTTTSPYTGPPTTTTSAYTGPPTTTSTSAASTEPASTFVATSVGPVTFAETSRSPSGRTTGSTISGTTTSSSAASTGGSTGSGTTTDSPTATTGSPTASSDSPTATSGSPTATSDSPTATSDSPTATTTSGSPTATTTSGSPIATTGPPIATTGPPIATTDSPITTTTSSGSPTTTTGSPTTTTGSPTTTAGSPTTTTTGPDGAITEPGTLEDWAIGVIVAAIIVLIIIIVIVVLAATGHFKKKDDEEDPEEEELDEEDPDDDDDGDFAMKTAAAQSLVGEIVAAQVPEASTEDPTDSTDSELAPSNDVTSTGAAELISSIISAIDDVDVNEDNEATTNTGGDGMADDPAPTTDATNALINEVLSDGNTDVTTDALDDDDITVSVSGTGTTNDSVARDEAYE